MPNGPAQEGGLSIKQKLGFGVCDLGGNLFFTVIAFLLLNYLTDTVGISAGLAGGIIMIGKIWDAVTDPLVGYLSDKTSSRWGRRRPYILFGSVPLFLTMILMFTNPAFTSQQALFVWGVISFCLLCTAYTVVNIPYNSLTPELTQDFHERTILNGYRFSFAVIGTLMGAGLALPLISQFADKNTGYSVTGAIFGFVMMVTALITFFSVREKDNSKELNPESFLESYRSVFKNKPFLLILGVYTLHIIGLTITTGIVVYYFKYIHGDEAITTIAMLILLVTAMFIIPISVSMSKKIGKKATYCIGIIIFPLSILLLAFSGHHFGVQYSLVIMVIAGIGLGFLYVTPWAIVPDAIEYNYFLTGKKTEGAFYGIWTFGIKIGQAIALGITGLVLSLSGYVAEQIQTQSAELAIQYLLGPIPAFFFLLALIPLYLYPIDENRYQEILTAINQGKS
ncbi:MFS transporter [bacterium]|nr:MFS transporter [bacterium]